MFEPENKFMRKKLWDITLYDWLLLSGCVLFFVLGSLLLLDVLIWVFNP